LERRHEDVAAISRRVGLLLERNQRAAATFEIQVVAGSDGRTQLTWKQSAKQLPVQDPLRKCAREFSL
jgi:hypothetical protein